MLKNIKLFYLIAGLLFINAAGFFLRYFDLDTWFIILGFRFHFSILMSFLFTAYFIDHSYVKKIFLNPEKQKFFGLLIFAFLPILFLPLDIFVLKQFNFLDKDYFFELGVSSVFDYPILLIWNAPQIFMFYFLIASIFINKKSNFLKIFLVAFFLFLYEIIPLDFVKEASSYKINYINIFNNIFTLFLSAFICYKIRNIYVFTIVLFTVLWSAVLFWGSTSGMTVNIFLASQYDSWHGLINPGGKYLISSYLMPAYLIYILVVSIKYLERNKVSSVT